MAKVCFLIPASPNSAFFSQIAAFSAALARLRWTGWEPSVHVCLGGEVDTAALQRWRPHLQDVSMTMVAPTVVAADDCWYGQIDSLYRFAPRDADVLVRMDADTLPVGDLEDVLDFVVADRCIAGVMAHFPFPGEAGQSARAAWLAAADGLIDRPIDFRLAYSLVGAEAAADDRDAPFYVNDGAVFLPRACFDTFAEHYLALRPKVMPRLTVPYYAGQVGLTLAITQSGLRTCALPIRYNFPNDERATRRFPEELAEARIIHYLRTEVVDRATLFDQPEEYESATSGELEGADGVLGRHMARLLGKRYPFTRPSAEPAPALVAPPAAAPAKRIRNEALTLQATMRIINASGLFDADYYLAQHPEVRAAGVDPLRHYLVHGEKEKRRPSAGFDPAEHRRTVMDPAGRTGNALLDFVEQRSGTAPAAEAGDPSTADMSPLKELATRFTQTGELQALMNYKRALVATVGFDRAVDSYAMAQRVRDSGQVRGLKLGAQRDHLRRSGLSYAEWHAGGEPFAIPAPRIIGDFPSRPLEFVSRSQYVGSIADALVRGRSSLVVAGDEALFDYEPYEAALFDVELDIDPAVFAVRGKTLWVPVPANPDDAMAVDEAYSLLGPQTGAFGDWMYQTLPRYVAADASGLLPIVPVLVDAGLPPQILDSLQAVLRPGVRVIEVPPFRSVRVGRLWCSPSLHYAPAREVMDHRYRFDYSCPAPALFLPTVQEISRRVPTPPQAMATPSRVYLARKPGLWRRLVNDGAIERIASEHGLAVVYPEELSFAQQVALVRGATHVVAPEGSALLLMYFAHPGTRLCILNHQNFETTAYDGLLDGVDLQVILGPFVEKDPQFELRSNYRIDEAVFAGFLDGWLR